MLFLNLAPSSELQSLAAELRHELQRADIQTDPKPFRPHLTLARPRQPWACEDGPKPLTWRVERLLLLESRRIPTGSEYREEAAWDLFKPLPPGE